MTITEIKLDALLTRMDMLTRGIDNLAMSIAALIEHNQDLQDEVVTTEQQPTTGIPGHRPLSG